jgi:hypothetical protein
MRAFDETALGDYYPIERQVDVLSVVSVGGWSDYSAIELSLVEPTNIGVGNVTHSQ